MSDFQTLAMDLAIILAIAGVIACATGISILISTLRRRRRVALRPEDFAKRLLHASANGRFGVVRVYGAFYVVDELSRPFHGPMSSLSRASLYCDLAAVDEDAAQRLHRGNN